MGCGASHAHGASYPRVEPTSDGTGAFVHLRNLEKGISLAGVLAPKKQFEVAARNGVAYWAPITDPTASTEVACRDSYQHRRLSSAAVVDGMSPFFYELPHIEPVTDPTFRSVATKASPRDSSERGKPSVLELSHTTRVSTTSTRPSV
jgi:hypothetical protein